MDLYRLKKLFLFFITLSLFINCSIDKEVPIPENAVFEPQTELISLTGNNNQLKLIWKPVVILNFKSYKVYRFDSNTNEFMNPAQIVNSGKLVFESTDSLTTAFIDNEIPFNSFTAYAIVTEHINEKKNVEHIISVNYLSYENKNLSFSLTSLVKLEDGSLKLEWEKDTNLSFENYTIYAVNEDYLNNEEVFNNEKIVKVSSNQNENSFIDATPFTKGQIFYVVSKVINGKRIRSKNYLSIQNPRSLHFKPGQSLKNPNNKNEIIIINRDGGEVLFYNIKSLSSHKVLTNGPIFFCSIGKFNGVEDLYVPSKNGRVFVIDLISHKIKETINLQTDYNILSAIPINNHILFHEKHTYADIGGMFVYDRINDKVINRNGSFGMGANSKLVYGTENYFFNLSNDGLEYGSSSAISRLNINGNEVTTNIIFNDSKSDSRLFTLSDDKTFFVSTKYGYQSDVNYQNFTEVTTKKYYQDGFFGDAKIASDNKHIYFSVPDYSQIEVFEKNNFTTIIKQYKTTGTPLLIEIFQNKIISLNQLENSYYIETIPH
jgi:hypothetical protein